ncbi:protein GENOMES UNCOUPLED 4 [Carex rostrata]
MPYPKPMATTSLQALRQTFLHRHNHQPFTTIYNPETKLTFQFNPGKSSTKYVLFSNLSSSSLTTTPTSTNATATSTTPSLNLLERHLSSENYRQADEVTRRLIIDLAGEAAQKRGYVFFTEVQFISSDDLREIDRLWRTYSRGRFGYSVQKRLWEKSRRDFTRFFIRVGWMKKLDTEVEQYNYRAFPDEFVWELKDDTPPEGHLPLTNALRGTQLLTCIFTHPAFDDAKGAESDEEVREEKSDGGEQKGVEKANERQKLLDFKPDYSF